MKTMDTRQLCINGQWVDSTGRGTIAVENPATEEIIATIPAGTEADAVRALEAAQAAQPAWAALPAVERANLLLRLADLVVRDRDVLARIITSEQGKPLRESYEELGGTETFLRWAAESARRIGGDIMPSDNVDERIEIHRVPYGVVVALTAWNFPSALVARKIGPALMAGNTVVIKPHEATPLSSLEIARLADEAGFPPGTVNVVMGTGRTVGDTLVRHPITRFVTMTGSVRAGQEIMKAGADTVTMLRLELGGKAPFLVMEDADVDKAVDALMISRFYNNGQVCTCADRVYLHEAIADEFIARLLPRVEALTQGDPMGNPDLGAKVSAMEVEKLVAMVDGAVTAGATLLTGGGRPEGDAYEKGHWFAPTVLVDVDDSFDIMRKEIFGPVIPITRVTDFEQALACANDSDYGLSAYLFTRDLRRINRLVQDLDFGEIYVNRPMGEAINAFHSGHKLSGIGGEDGAYGVDAYFQKKTIYVNYAE
jgi:lactaldehyde dehydrogenase/glycolaldehyde dehydrogenase